MQEYLANDNGVLSPAVTRTQSRFSSWWRVCLRGGLLERGRWFFFWRVQSWGVFGLTFWCVRRRVRRVLVGMGFALSSLGPFQDSPRCLPSVVRSCVTVSLDGGWTKKIQIGPFHFKFAKVFEMKRFKCSNTKTRSKIARATDRPQDLFVCCFVCNNTTPIILLHLHHHHYHSPAAALLAA